MSIFPSVDLVTDVAQAADPQKRSAAVARLGQLSETRLRSDDEFANVVESARHTVDAPTGARFAAKAPVASAMSLIGARTTPSAAEAAEKFEAFVLQSCLETILPDAQDGLFGHGAAGNAWRSLLAEEIATQIAKAGGIGLKKMLAHNLDQRADGGNLGKPKSAAT